MFSIKIGINLLNGENIVAQNRFELISNIWMNSLISLCVGLLVDATWQKPSHVCADALVQLRTDLVWGTVMNHFVALDLHHVYAFIMHTKTGSFHRDRGALTWKTYNPRLLPHCSELYSAIVQLPTSILGPPSILIIVPWLEFGRSSVS